MVLLENFWVAIGPLEGASRFEELLARKEKLPEKLRARALRCYAGSLLIGGEYERSHRANEESLALFRAIGDDEGVAILLHRLGMSTLALGDTEEARRILNESVQAFHRAGSERGEAETTGGLGYVAREEGDYETAIELFTRAAELAEVARFAWWRVAMLSGLAECLLELGRGDQAEPVVREHLTLAREIGDRQWSLLGLVLFAWLAASRGDESRAGLLWGGVEAEERRAPVGQWELERDNYVGKVVGAGGEELERARERGRTLSFEAAMDEALALPS